MVPPDAVNLPLLQNYGFLRLGEYIKQEISVSELAQSTLVWTALKARITGS
jgi:hypothetical protein